MTSDPRPDEPWRGSRWKRLEALYQEASARPAADRLAFLAEACADDEAMRRNVESLLNESNSDDGFLARPPLAVPPHVVADLIPATMIGTSLGGYHLLALLGAGGMGEVYRARDAKLGREVAIKILPSAFTSHPERLARFEREARMLAAVNHPNICAIYGVDEADGVRFLMLELVEGDTLAETIAQASGSRAARCGLRVDQALGIARQIADALEVAHDKGIVHRDLKPANIKITPDAVVKVLDFGLAKLVASEGMSPDLSNTPQEGGGPRPGAVVGTAAYMSPEQARGLSVDRRTDIWAFGCVVYEMLTGRAAFGGETTSDSIAKILEREPDWSALPADTPLSIRRLLLRCLIKDPRQRLRDICDARLELETADELLPGAIAMPARLTGVRRRAVWLPWVALAALAVAVGTWEARRAATSPASVVSDNPLADAMFSRVTNWEGTEEHADISPDGRFVTFLADKAGQLDVWVSQVGTGKFDNLTVDLDPLLTPGNLLRSVGFSGDGSEIWFNPKGNPGLEKVLLPLTGGVPRAFLATGYSTPAWSPDNAQLVYIASSTPGDPLSVADRTGADARLITVHGQDAEGFLAKGVHTHNPVWSTDGQWIYFVHGREAAGEMDVWRMQPSGERAERLTHQNAPVNFLAPIDARTVLYVARAEDWSGPWLWALDVESKVTRRATAGLEQYTFVSASRDGRRIVATVERPTATLWRVPLDQPSLEADAEPYRMPSDRALAPRFGGTSVFYLSLSSRGTGDGLWRVQHDQAFEVRKGADGVLTEPPAASPDGTRVAVVVRQQGKRRIVVMTADGTNARSVAASVELRGVEGQGTVDWSPDGAWLVTAGDDGRGPGVFKIPVDDGVPVRLVADEAVNPVWSPAGDLIVYAVPFAGGGGRNALRAVRPDGTPVEMPQVQVRRGGAHRFLRSGAGLVYLQSLESRDFWLLDLPTKTTRQLTHLRDRGYLSHFDVTPDGKYLVFDRSRQNSDVVLIERPR